MEKGGGGAITWGAPANLSHEKQRTNEHITLAIAPWPHEKLAIPGKEGVVDGFECLVARSGLFFGS